MKDKIRDYIELIFADAPDCKETRELKAEMYNNVCDRYDDLIKEGMSPTAAYNKSIAGIGDVSELVADIQREHQSFWPDGDEAEHAESQPRRTYSFEEQEEIRKYRMRRGMLNSISIALYILCWVPVIIFGQLFGDVGGVIGIALMMIMIAAATAMMIMKSAMKPLFLRGVKDFDDDDDDDDDEEKEKRRKRGKRRQHPVLRAIKGALGCLMLVLYFAVSFATGAWYITWVIFLINAAFDNIIDAIFELCGKKYDDTAM